jgi:hypothetical protein
MEGTISENMVAVAVVSNTVDQPVVIGRSMGGPYLQQRISIFLWILNNTQATQAVQACVAYVACVL